MDEQKVGKEQASFRESLSDEQKGKMAKEIAEVGSLLQDEWRAPKKL